jgi:Cu(I)/Ag(I) efflux system membrane fusion protein
MKVIRLYGIVILIGLAFLPAGCGLPGDKKAAGSDTTGKRDMRDSSMGGMAMGHTSNAGEVWTCPMHPDVMKDRQGTCPICGMDLVKKEMTSPKVKVIGLENLLLPTNGFVLSTVPAIGMRRETVYPVLEVLGTVGYDTRLQNTIAARVSGRVERLYVRYRYQHVHRGQRIMDIYSRELATDEQEYLYLLKNDPGNTGMIEAARQRLLLLGVSSEQLAEVAHSGVASATLGVFSPETGHIHEAGSAMPSGSLDVAAGTTMVEELPLKEGMYVEKGRPVFQVFDTDRGWVQLNLFPGQGALVRRGDPVDVVPETGPEKRFSARVDLIEPLYRQGERSLTLRVYFDNRSRDIPAGSAVKATIRPAAVAGNWLPKEAVLSLGMDQVVFLRDGGGFRAHKITTGITAKDEIQVLSGLAALDSVAAQAQYLMDSEDFIQVTSRR